MPELGEAQVAIRAKLDKLDNDLSDAKKRVEGSASDMERSLSSLGSAAKKALGALAIREVAQFSAEMYTLGTTSLRTKSSLDDLTGGQAAAYIQSITLATRGTVSQMEAAQIATRLYGMGLADTTEKAGEMARTAAILGASFSHIGAAQAAEELSLMLANMSYARLDAFGVSSGMVRTRVNELKAAFPGMTTEAAFAEAAMEALSEKAETLSSVLDEQATGIERVQAQWADAKTAAAEYFAVAGQPIVEGVGDAIEGAGNTLQMIAQTRAAMTDLRREVATTSGSYDEWKASMQAIFQDIGPSRYFALSFENLDLSQKAYDNLSAEITDTSRNMQLFHEQEYQVAAGAQEVTDAFSIETASAQELDSALVAGQITVEEYTEAKRAFMTDAQKAAEIVRDEAAALQEQARAADEAYRAQKNLRDFVAGLADDQEKYGGALARSGAGFDNFISFLENSGQAAGLTSEQVDEWALSYGALTPQQLEQKRLLGDLQQAMTRYDETFTPDEWRNAFDLVQTGQLNAAAAALENEANQDRVVRKLSVMSGQAITTAGDTEDATTTMGDAFQDLATDMGPAEGRLDRIANRVAWLQRNGNINININTSGGGPDDSDTTRRAAGGPVYPGRGYLVGEEGPEFFMPETAGTIIPNNAMGSAGMLHEIGAAGGGGSTTVIVNLSPQVPAGLMDPAVAERLAWDLAPAIVREIKSSGQLRELIA